MGLGQQILSIGAIFLLTMLILNVHQGTGARMTTMYVNEATIVATGLAQSMLNEIQSKDFDENTINNSIDTTDSLTAVASLGTETGESTPTQFDDVDDYDGLIITNSSSNMGTYTIEVSVYYIPLMDPETVSASRTFCKRIDVSVSNDYLPEDVTLYHIDTY